MMILKHLHILCILFLLLSEGHCQTERGDFRLVSEFDLAVGVMLENYDNRYNGLNASMDFGFDKRVSKSLNMGAQFSFLGSDYHRGVGRLTLSRYRNNKLLFTISPGYSFFNEYRVLSSWDIAFSFPFYKDLNIYSRIDFINTSDNFFRSEKGREMRFNLGCKARGKLGAVANGTIIGSFMILVGIILLSFNGY